MVPKSSLAPSTALNAGFESARIGTSTRVIMASRRRDIHHGDRAFFWLVRSVGFGVFLVLLAIAYQLYLASGISIQAFGLSFLHTSNWDPVQDKYGALPVIFGTLVSSFLALLFAAPISVGIALFISELAPKRLATLVGFLVEMLAAIPSVVYGLWGIFVLAPWLREHFQPWMIEKFGFIPLFTGPAYGVGMFAAGVILAIMIIPTISAISREVFTQLPRGNREAALALGATRWEMMKIAVLKSSRAGVLGAIILGLGRALGETMAVTMVIGNRAEIFSSLFAPAQTMASVIANEYAEATSDLHLSSLAYIGLLLFVVTFIVNGFARILVWRVTRGERGAR